MDFTLWGASLVAEMVKNLSTMQETWVWSLGQEHPLEKRMATHSRILIWRILWTEGHGGLQSMELQRARYNWATNTFTFYTLKLPLLREIKTYLNTILCSWLQLSKTQNPQDISLWMEIVNGRWYLSQHPQLFPLSFLSQQAKKQSPFGSTTIPTRQL